MQLLSTIFLTVAIPLDMSFSHDRTTYKLFGAAPCMVSLFMELYT